MGTQIEIDENSFALLDKYCNELVRPAVMGAVLGRVLEAWYAQAAKEWAKDRNLIPKLPKVPEGITQGVDINSEDARIFLTTLKKLNEKTGLEINPASLASWLVGLFIKMYDIKKKSKYKIKMGMLKKG